MTGIVLYGINRIYTVEAGEALLRCHIKGKTLPSETREYNPLAPGDLVEVRIGDTGEGLILSRLPRRNSLWRWNRKGRAVQTMAANLDLLLCVCSPANPPFRPRFVDRVIVVARRERIPVSVVLNKADLPVERTTVERLRCYESMGIPVLSCSARTGAGIGRIEELLDGSLSALVGQSGVGKSSLLNTLNPTLELRTAALSAKYDRGTHVTNYGRIVSTAVGRCIDTPGIREIDLYGLTVNEVAACFDDFHEPARRCGYAPCTHTHEPDCGVKAAVAAGAIHPDRYESYVRIVHDLELSERLAKRPAES